ncbi:MAG: putative transcriptional regulator YheO [Candidatus Marinamargulisbacteria bacterium]|jgi:predicted transcriptional regulator YheO
MPKRTELQLTRLDEVTRVAQSIADMFSPLAETVIHDLSENKVKIIEIFNGKISGRETGQESKDFDYLFKFKKPPKEPIFFTWIAPNGTKLKGSTVIFASDGNKLDFSLSINFNQNFFIDIASSIQNFIDYQPPEQVSKKVRTHFLASKDEIRNEILQCTWDLDLDPAKLTRKDKRKIVETLVTVLSEELKITKMTVYNYIGRMKEDAENIPPIDLS